MKVGNINMNVIYIKKYTLKEILISLVIILLTFEGLLYTLGISFISYFDEIVEVFCISIIIIGLFYKSIYKRRDITCLFILFVLLIVGLLGNYIYRFQTSQYVVFLDVLATFKSFSYYYGFKCLVRNRKNICSIIEITANVFKHTIVVMCLFATMNLFVDIGMSSDVRFGIRSFSFLFEGAGNCSLIFYNIVFVLILNMALKQKNDRNSKFLIAITLFVWCATLRARAIAFSVLYIILVYFVLENKKVKIKKWQLCIAGILVFFICKNQLIYYFTNTKTARYNLMYYGVVTLVTCFPIGSGFATYASDMAYNYYSVLYKKYGFNYIYGLSITKGNFVNDSFWAEIMGQFGFIGMGLFISFIILFFRNIMKNVSNNFEYFAVLYICLILLAGSMGTKTYMHFVISPVFICLSLFATYLEKSEGHIKRKLKSNN